MQYAEILRQVDFFETFGWVDDFTDTVRMQMFVWHEQRSILTSVVISFTAGEAGEFAPAWSATSINLGALFNGEQTTDAGKGWITVFDLCLVFTLLLELWEIGLCLCVLASPAAACRPRPRAAPVAHFWCRARSYAADPRANDRVRCVVWQAPRSGPRRAASTTVPSGGPT